jgi:ABC-type multidrug transport system ATPase subunit
MEIRLEDVWHTYDGATYALKGISLVFKDPGLHLVLGPNGAGKTTLLKIATFILRPSKGRVLVNGRDFWGLSELEKQSIRKQVAYVHDKPVLVRGTTKYNLMLGLILRGENSDRDVLEYASRYGLADALNKPVHSLSAGQAKAVAILRALVLRPRILALDEPFTFLDSYRTQLLLQDIKRLVEEGTTVIVSTHYMYKELEKMAINIVEIVNGEITARVR